MSHAEKQALQRLVDSVKRQLPKPTEQPTDDAQMATDEAQRIVARSIHGESANR